MMTEHLGRDPFTWIDGQRSFARPSPAASPTLQLPVALQILTARMRDAVARRRTSPPGTEPYRRADEEVAYLNELFTRLQRRMEIPTEIWRLEEGRRPERGRIAVSRQR